MDFFFDPAADYRLLEAGVNFQVVALDLVVDADGRQSERHLPIGSLEQIWDGTLRVLAGVDRPVKLGRVTTPDEGKTLLVLYRQAGLLRDLAETWGRSDMIHVRLHELGARP